MNATPFDRMLEFALGDKATRELSPDLYAREFVRDVTKHAAPKLEEARMGLRDTGEDGLTHSLLLPLYSTYQGASRETDVNGHVDVSLKHPLLLSRILLGEAKLIGSGKAFEWYAQGLVKLVGKYNSGHNNLGMMICYCRFPEMYTVLSKYQGAIAAEKTADFQGHGDVQALGLEGSPAVFVTTHLSAGRPLNVAHVWVNMYSPTDAELFAQKRPKARRRRPSASGAGGRTRAHTSG
jgi:hypothetical protein